VAIANFALRKLIANNQLSTIFQPIMLNVAVCHLGLRIIARGRFTRNQRATLNVFHFGKVPLNTFSIPIDYCFASIPLKFGVGSLKIWIGRTS
jgi:ribosomal protein S3